MPEIVNDVAREYAEAGFRCIPCNGKRPAAGNEWQINASTAPEWLDRWWPEDEDNGQNIGILTGDGFVVIDIDPRAGGDDTWARLVAAYGEPETTVESKTGGFGRHLYYRFHGSAVGSLGPGVDVKGPGGQVIEYPSIHPETGNQYEWVDGKDPREALIGDAPPWLVGLLTRRDAAPARDSGRQVWQPWCDWTGQEQHDIATALQAIPPDIDYPQWVEIGMALHSTGASQAFAMWEAWSRGGSKYTPGECARKWRSFREDGNTQLGTVFWFAQQNPEYSGNTPPSVQGVEIPTSLIEWEPETPEPFPTHLLNVPGMVGELVTAIDKSAAYKQPALALASALTIVSALAARRYKTSTGAGLNLMVAGIAGTGGGKDHGRTCLTDALIAAGCADRIGGDDIASSAAIVEEIGRKPHVKVFRKDEFGEWLQKIGSKRAPPHLADIKGTINELMTASTSTYMGRAKASSEKQREPIHHPNLVLYCTGTPESTFSAMSSSDSENGFLNRFAIFWGNKDRGLRDRKARSFHLSEDLKSRMRAISGSLEPGELPDLMDVSALTDAKPTLIPVEIAPDADDVFRNVELRANAELNRGNHIWARAELLALKLSALVAIGIDSDKPVVDVDLARWGADLSQHLTERFAQEFNSRQAGSTHHQILNDLRKTIYRLGGQASRSDFARYLQQYSKREREEAIKTLVEGGFATMEEHKTAGRPKTIFKMKSKSKDKQK